MNQAIIFKDFLLLFLAKKYVRKRTSQTIEPKSTVNRVAQQRPSERSLPHSSEGPITVFSQISELLGPCDLSGLQILQGEEVSQSSSSGGNKSWRIKGFLIP